MYVPDREAIFEDIEYTEACENIHCHNIHTVHGGGDPVCAACCSAECPRANIIADEVKQFVGDNDDIFRYIMPVNEG